MTNNIISMPEVFQEKFRSNPEKAHAALHSQNSIGEKMHFIGLPKAEIDSSYKCKPNSSSS